VTEVYGRGIHISDSQNIMTDGTISNNLLGYLGNDGIRISSAAGWKVKDNHVYAVCGSGIMVIGAFATSVSDNYIEGFGLWDTADQTSRNSVFRIAPTYSAGSTYAVGQAVFYSGSTYTSLVEGNLGHTPSGGAPYWIQYDLSASVAGIVSWQPGYGRPLHVKDNVVSMGHPSWAFNANLYYRGIVLYGTATGSAADAFIKGNFLSSEDRAAPATSYPIRYIGNAVGLNVVSSGNKLGTGWVTAALKDATVTLITTDAGSA
jgi:hypothetical protein